MPELIAKSALGGHRALTLGSVTLAEVNVGPVTSIALLPGGEKAVSKGLKPLGLMMPEPNRFAVKGAARIIWTGRDQAFLTGVQPPLLEGAAVTDQSDGWAVLAVSGPEAIDALMRLIPVDLRASVFPVGRAVRAPLNHMTAVLLRTGDDAFELWVFRSMARTAWHEIETAMEALAARAALKP